MFIVVSYFFRISFMLLCRLLISGHWRDQAEVAPRPAMVTAPGVGPSQVGLFVALLVAGGVLQNGLRRLGFGATESPTEPGIEEVIPTPTTAEAVGWRVSLSFALRLGVACLILGLILGAWLWLKVSGGLSSLFTRDVRVAIANDTAVTFVGGHPGADNVTVNIPKSRARRGNRGVLESSSSRPKIADLVR